MICPGMNFGMTVRAARLGYHAVRGLGFVRIRANGPPYWIDFAPFDGVPQEKAKGSEYHVVWWGGDDEGLFVAHFKELHSGLVLSAFSIQVDDDGEPLASTN